VQLLPWKGVESGTFRINRVRPDAAVEVQCGSKDERTLPETFPDYDPNPREHTLSLISTVLDVHTRVSDLYSSPHDQVREQIRLTVESVKERQESELINNADYGLLNNAVPSQRIATRKGPPTPDDLDELIVTGVEGAGVLPRPSTRHRRLCSRVHARGVPPTQTIFGSSFLTWRGIPLVPSDKVPIDPSNRSSILLLRRARRSRRDRPVQPGPRASRRRALGASWASIAAPWRPT
jgi:hypothetical protein